MEQYQFYLFAGLLLGIQSDTTPLVEFSIIFKVLAIISFIIMFVIIGNSIYVEFKSSHSKSNTKVKKNG